jgi:hypothetical protein
MRRTLPVLCAVLLAVLGARPADAQYRYRPYPISDPATGETYHVEFSTGLWFASPALTISSESLGIPGSQIDAVADLGFAKATFKELKLVLRPARKHKFRFDYVPIKYETDTILSKDIVFNGLRYKVGLPVKASLDWKSLQIGYEYDFVYRDRGYVGLLVGADYTRARAELSSPLDHEWAQARAPVPVIGGAGRVYVYPNVSITGELSGMKVPESIDKKGRYALRVIDVDLYGTLNFTNNFAFQSGYRSFSVRYKVEQDFGDFVEKGFYLRAVARF